MKLQTQIFRFYFSCNWQNWLWIWRTDSNKIASAVDQSHSRASFSSIWRTERRPVFWPCIVHSFICCIQTVSTFVQHLVIKYVQEAFFSNFLLGFQYGCCIWLIFLREQGWLFNVIVVQREEVVITWCLVKGEGEENWYEPECFYKLLSRQLW